MTMRTQQRKAWSWMRSFLTGRVGDTCKDLRACMRFDSPRCCADRLRAERAIEGLYQERRLWSH